MPAKLRKPRLSAWRLLTSPAAVAAASDIVLVCVINTAAVEDVISGPSGIITTGRLDGKVLVDHSTTEIEATKLQAQALADRTGMAFIDAPVSGGPDAARTGTLAIMAGGEESAIRKVAPLMEKLGHFTHMGEIGAGQATKLVNQTLVLTNYCVIAEAVRLAQAYGVDAKKIPDALAPAMPARTFCRSRCPAWWTKISHLAAMRAKSSRISRCFRRPPASIISRCQWPAQALTLFRMLVAGGKSELDGTAVVSLIPKPAP